MRFNHAIPTGNSVQYFRHPVTNSLFDKIFHEQGREQYPDKRIHEKE